MYFRLQFFIAFLASASFAGLVSAQELPPIDQDKIDAEIEAINPEVSAFATEVAKRAEAYAQDANTITDHVMSRLGKDVEVGDTEIDSILALAPEISETREKAANTALGVIIFASFSMDEDALRSLVVDAHKAGVPIMLRGFADGSLSATAERMRNLLGEIEGAGGPEAEFLGGVVIDPRAYRVFRVDQVPTFIALDGPLPDCDGLDCSAPSPPHDRISGNISLSAALQALASEGDKAASHARTALATLEGTP